MNLGTTIKRLRKKRQLRQGELAERSGISQTYLSLIEHNKKQNVSTEILENISLALDVPLPVIFWYGIEESSIKPEKIDIFRKLKPVIDRLIEDIF